MIKCTRCDCDTTHDYIANLVNGQPYPRLKGFYCLDCMTEKEHDIIEMFNFRLEEV